jgi:malonyl-CoA O-methyltransferase
MKISVEFSKHAMEYNSYNIIQNRVITKLLNDLSVEPQYILDLGCGSGALCQAIKWKYKHFTGVDFAPGMLELHPKSNKIEAIYGDFNDVSLFDTLQTCKFDHIFSASALQWSENLEELLKSISLLNTPVSLAIFTSGTFKTLNQIAGLKPLLRDKEEIKRLSELYFNAKYEVVSYKLDFESVREMFRYIKRSGVSGSRNLMSFKDMKRLMKEYPLNYLEFEVAYIYNS